MKKKSLNKRLAIDKSTIANLNTEAVKGGAGTYEQTFCVYCNTAGVCGSLKCTLIETATTLTNSYQGSCA